jgi:acetolactate synthase I/II/III large subunit
MKGSRAGQYVTFRVPRRVCNVDLFDDLTIVTTTEADPGGRVSLERRVDEILAPRGTCDALTTALVRFGVGDAATSLARVSGCTRQEAEDALEAGLARVDTTSVALTGAEAVAFLLAQNGVGTVFAYAGTSELALCDSMARVPGVTLINGRGDKESVFEAAGASLLRANRGVAIVHGARGLTNAAGAVADARRNEVGTVIVVGLPSTASASFLPPHGEDGLLPALGNFVKWWYEASAVPSTDAERLAGAVQFVSAMRRCLRDAAAPPRSPTLFGLPQDVAETAWIPFDALAAPEDGAGHAQPQPDERAVERAAQVLAGAERPLILIDDYALRYDGMRNALQRLAERVAAPVFQVRYRRGPMLFERLSQHDVANFVGWLDPSSSHHRGILDQADLVITIEDRNLYERVVGRLPACPKIAINSDAGKVAKNRYLSRGDEIVEGHPVLSLEMLVDRLGIPSTVRTQWAGAGGKAPGGPEPVSPIVAHMRRSLVHTLAAELERCEAPVLIDDSQMFGGLISDWYDLLPARLRVFGGHGGFVGGGLSSAVGLALAEDVQVFCTLGDQAFTNAIQGLVATVEQRAPVVFIVCNNGESVSLRKQAMASGSSWLAHGKHPYLRNPPAMRYAAIAMALGMEAHTVPFAVDRGEETIDVAAFHFGLALAAARQCRGPVLIELLLPSYGEAWNGIWITAGFETSNAAHDVPEPTMASSGA